MRDGVSICETPIGWRGGTEGERGGAVSRALEKGLTLLSLIAEGHDTLPRLARASGMPKSTAHRLAAVLVSQGFLRYREGRFILGYRLLELSERARRHIGYLTVARPHLESLSSETGETVHLGELADGHIVYLEKIEGERSLQMRSYVGLRVPARTTALGKVLIAARPREEWERHVNVVAESSPSATSQEARFEELHRVRRQGYAVDREENEPGTCCVAAPVWAAEGRVIAAISISGAAMHITERRQRELVPLLTRTALAVSRELGGGDRPRLDTPRPAGANAGPTESAAAPGAAVSRATPSRDTPSRDVPSRDARVARRSGGGEP